ncbi:MAG: type II toxin-antitoxin system PemK/MazF family toxin [Elusimicrobia bacterium]|nr:type II toxin-antitoxin system PemK/MazF family toxin [Elusimicrobiota bacterium]
MKRGEIYWVNLDPTIGAEIKKTRPALVVSNDQNNEAADTVTVLPITSKTDRIYPFEAVLPKSSSGLKEDCKIKANQIRTVDKRRLGQLMGSISAETMAKVEQAILLHLGIERG